MLLECSVEWVFKHRHLRKLTAYPRFEYSGTNTAHLFSQYIFTPKTKRIMIIAVAIISGFVILVLIGQTAKEKLVISKDVKLSRQNFPPGMTRVEFDSVIKSGTKIVGNIYIPNDYQEGEKRTALVVSPPATSVKEQAAHYYAEKMRQKGYICLTFDPRGIGETKGLEGNINPYTIANDISSGVSFLQSLPQVDSERLGNLGLCAPSVSSAYETIHDSRIKALGLAVPSVDGAKLAGGTNSIVRVLLFFVGGIVKILGLFGVNPQLEAFPKTEEGLAKGTEMQKGMATYYAPGKVGFHPRYKNKIAFFSGIGVAALDMFKLAPKLNNTPIHIETGDKAQSLKPAEHFFKMLKGPTEKSMNKIKGSDHFELYWNDEYVDQAVAGLDSFYKKYI